MTDKLYLNLIHILLPVYALLCLYPFLLTVAVSFTPETMITKYGYSLIPRAISFDTYRFIFTGMRSKILDGYLVSIFVTVTGTVLSMVVSTSFAYAASVRNFRFRTVLNIMCFIPMIFNAGLLPWYITLSKYYGLVDQIVALFIPSLMSVWNVFILRNFLSGVPHSITESAIVDGAGHFRIFAVIAVPLARVGLTVVALYYALYYWNDFFLALMFMRRENKYPLQFLLYNMLSKMQFYTNTANARLGYRVEAPLETAKMAVTCITIGPIVLLYPFMQRYFIKGIAIGAIKG